MNLDEKHITPRKQDFSQWYQEVIEAAKLAEHSPVRGSMIIKPNGYAIWERVQSIIDGMLKAEGVRNAYFPLLIPESFLKREADHVEGFAPEVAVVTYAGGQKLKEGLVIRPTSETIINDAFSRWIVSHRDLPLIINQWANVVRWELRPRLFLRTTEFLWQEGHTAHATAEEAVVWAKKILQLYRRFAEEYFAIPVILGTKSENEKFAGAETTYTVEAMMQDGKALQFATSHFLGQHFSKPFGIDFTAEDGSTQYCWQTSWGLSTRVIGGLIMSHSDDIGLVLPPKVAPTQIVITPITKTTEAAPEIIQACQHLAQKLIAAGLRVHFDTRNLRPGEKFYEWERMGVPIRVEIGPRDLLKHQIVIARRDSGEKKIVKQQEAVQTIGRLLDDIQQNLFTTAQRRLTENTVSVDTWPEFESAIADGKFVLAHWGGDTAVEQTIKERTKATLRSIPFDDTTETAGECIMTGKRSTRRVLFAKSY